MPDIFEELVERYGIERLLEDNDLEPAFVLKLLWEEGYIDLEEYD